MSTIPVSSIPIVRNAGEGDERAFAGGGLHTWMLLAEETGGALFLFEDVLVKGKTTPLHAHPEADELSYVLEGEIEIQVDGTRTRLRSGGVSFVPRGVAHAFIVLSDTARIVAIQTPGDVGQPFYRGASDPSLDDRADRLDLDRLHATAAANPSAIAILGPPPFAATTVD